MMPTLDFPTEFSFTVFFSLVFYREHELSSSAQCPDSKDMQTDTVTSLPPFPLAQTLGPWLLANPQRE